MHTTAHYVGMIGSKRKRDGIYSFLRSEGFSEDDFGRVHSPIGLEIGAETPEEIAEASAGNLLPVPWIEPEDVANLVDYIASDKARYATGSQFVLDAGLLTV